MNTSLKLKFFLQSKQHFSITCKFWTLNSQLAFLLMSTMIMIKSNESWNTETHKMDRNPTITNHNLWPLELVEVNFCFLRGLLKWLTAAKDANVSWLLNLRVQVFLQSAANFKQMNDPLGSKFFSMLEKFHNQQQNC